MNFEIDSIITIGNNEEYLIVDRLELNDKKYLYLSAMKKEYFTIARVDNINGQIGLSKLEETEYKSVLEQLLKRHIDVIEKIEVKEE